MPSASQKPAYMTAAAAMTPGTIAAREGQGPDAAIAYPTTALSVISSPRSMIAKASRSSASVMQSGGLV